MEKEEEMEGSVVEEQEEEEVVVHADVGDMLDLKPVLSIQKSNYRRM